jgi:hypothetical protein
MRGQIEWLPLSALSCCRTAPARRLRAPHRPLTATSEGTRSASLGRCGIKRGGVGGKCSSKQRMAGSPAGADAAKCQRDGQCAHPGPGCWWGLGEWDGGS